MRVLFWSNARCLVDEIALAKRSNSKAASPEISRHPRKASAFSLADTVAGLPAQTCSNVSNPVQPILNLKHEENTARPKHRDTLEKHDPAVRSNEMMKHENPIADEKFCPETAVSPHLLESRWHLCR